MPSTRIVRSDWILLLFAVACGIVLFTSLDRLWPLAATDLHVPPDELIERARERLIVEGIAADSHVAASRIVVDEELLDYLHRAFGIDQTQAWIREGMPIYQYDVRFKRRGDPDSAWVYLHPETGVLSWGRSVQEDAPGRRITMEQARQIAGRALTGAGFEETGRIERARPERVDHFFVYERYLSRSPELRERRTLTVTGGVLTAVHRELVLPERARRDARVREAPSAALQTIGFLLVGLAALGALVVFLTRLQRGEILLRRSAWWVAIIATFFMLTQILRSANLLLQWDPLWPRWVATLQSLGFSLAQGAWIALALFIVIAAGDALDRELRAGRGDTLWSLGKGALFDRGVGVASFRGFLIGLICGAALVATIGLLETFAGAKVALQPQGFFFFALNSDIPALSTLLYFLMVALVEELGYRFFAGNWILSVTGRRALAIGVPAVLYGITHTGLPFVPPYEPFWGRAIAFTVVGAIWGWAYFRYDALTVVLSHFAADLFIFNWPRLASGDPVLVTKAIATIAAPLLPALLFAARRGFGIGERSREQPGL